MTAGVDSIEQGAFLCRHPETIKRMGAQGTYLVSTFMIIAMHREKGTPWVMRNASEMVEDHKRTLQLAMEAGIPIAMGTDGGPYAHGRNAMEMRLMTENGMTRMESIVASTKSAAQCLRLESDIGTLEAGKFADLLVVDGDPLQDISILEQ